MLLLFSFLNTRLLRRGCTVIVWMFLGLSASTVLAEGTRELAPNATDRVFLYTNANPYNNFGRYNSNDNQRLYIHIENPLAEQVYLGFSQPVNSGHYPCNGAVMIEGYFRIVDPTGRVVFPVIDNPNGFLLDNVSSNITSYSQAVAGPAPLAGAGGYTPFIFDPAGLPAGDYYVEFSRSSSTESVGNVMAFEWFDITVASKGSTPAAIDGRVFSRDWALFAPSISCGTDPTFNWFDRAFNGAFYIYTDEDIVSKVDFQGAGFQPAAFNMVFNDAGTTRTNDVIEDRKSRDNVRSSASQHRIFLNDPDRNIYPTGRLGEFSILPQYITCENGAACVQAEVTEPGQIDVLIDLDRASGDFIYDANTRDVLIAFKVEPIPGEQPPYVRCIPWDGRDGFGVKVPGLTEIQNADLLVRYTQGIYHFPIYDAEYMLNGFDVTTIRPIPNNGSPKRVYYDDSNIPDIFGAGIVQSKSEPFNGCDVPCHIWTNHDFGDLNTINTWFFAREEVNVQVENGDCPIEAFPDYDTTFSNTPVMTDILINDRGTETIDTTSIQVVFQSSNGTATFDMNTLLANYIPDTGFVGLDTFTYVFCYGILPVENLCDSSRVFITVLPTKEDCQNMIDDDGDGLIDCDDPECLPITPDDVYHKGNTEWWFVLLLLLFLFYFVKPQKRTADVFLSQKKAL